MATRKKATALPVFPVPGVYMTAAQTEDFRVGVVSAVTTHERVTRRRAIIELTPQTPAIREAALARMEAALA